LEAALGLKPGSFYAAFGSKNALFALTLDRYAEAGVTRRLYAAVRSEEATKPYMAHLLKLARSEPLKLQRG
ncbi:MAG: hypothetical protein AAFR53_14960, partial [Pseudomonadota bacterium]